MGCWGHWFWGSRRFNLAHGSNCFLDSRFQFGSWGGVLWGSHALLGLLACKRSGWWNGGTERWQVVSCWFSMAKADHHAGPTQYKVGQVGWQKKTYHCYVADQKNIIYRNDVCYFDAPLVFQPLNWCFLTSPAELKELPHLNSQGFQVCLKSWCGGCHAVHFWICAIFVGRRTISPNPNIKLENDEAIVTTCNNKFHYL